MSEESLDINDLIGIIKSYNLDEVEKIKKHIVWQILFIKVSKDKVENLT